MTDNGNGRLTNKQIAFVEYYLACGFNATEAARRAGYKGDDNTLASIGSQNLRKVKIAEKIKERLSQMAMTADEVLFLLKEHAQSEHTNYLDKNGNLEIKRLIADGKGHLIKQIKQTAQGRQIEFYDAQAALALLGKHHKLFTERFEHSGPDGGPLVIEYVNNWRDMKND